MIIEYSTGSPGMWVEVFGSLFTFLVRLLGRVWVAGQTLLHTYPHLDPAHNLRVKDEVGRL